MYYPELKQIIKPDSLEAAIEFLRQHPTADVIAGGTSRALRSRTGITELVDLLPLKLNRIKSSKQELLMESGATVTQLATSSDVAAVWGGVIAKAAHGIASTPLRNIITLGGNIVGLFPWSELPVALLCADAMVTIKGESERSLSMVDFIAEAYYHKLHNSDIITNVKVVTRADVFGYYEKFARTSFDYGIINLAMTTRISDGKFDHVRIAVGAIEACPLRLTKVEVLLEGKTLSEIAIENLLQTATESVTPRQDPRASVAYRKELAGILVKKAVQAIATQAGL